MPSKFTRKKVNGGIEAMIKRTKTPGTVDVGIIDAGSHVGGDMTVASIGFVHEFGSTNGTIPERSFIRSTINDKKNKIVSLQKQLFKKLIHGTMELDQALGLVGELLADEISRKIVAISSPPNTPETIDKKGSSNPLVDTGQLKNSITYEVNR